jgi:hypothetical protein
MAARSRLLVRQRLERLEVVPQVRDLEGAVHGVAGEQLESESAVAGAVERVDEDADAGGVHELDVAEVEDERPAECGVGGELCVELRADGDVERALDLDDHAFAAAARRDGRRKRRAGVEVHLRVGDRYELRRQSKGPQGFGLFLVDRLSSSWGVDSSSDFRVWFRLERDGAD